MHEGYNSRKFLRCTAQPYISVAEDITDSLKLWSRVPFHI